MSLKNELINDRVIYLISRSTKKELTNNEQFDLEEWLEQSADRQIFFDKIIKNQSLPISDWKASDTEKAYHKLQQRIYKRKIFRQWSIISATAAILVLLFSIWMNYPNNLKQKNKNISSEFAEISPGKFGGILTDKFGNSINLKESTSGLTISKNSIHYYDGSKVKDSDKRVLKSNILTANIKKGFTYSLTLADGTMVWLNSGSKLQFPQSFIDSALREVFLEGEGYFIVKHDAAHPFLVHTRRSLIQDVGTEFNVKDDNDDEFSKTTLIEGSIKASAKSINKTGFSIKGITILPGQQAMVVNDNLSISKADLEEETAWKSGYFRFNNEKLREVMKKLSRWYNIEVEFEGPELDEGFYGTISRSKNLAQVLSMFEGTKNVGLRIEGRRVIVKTNN